MKRCVALVLAITLLFVTGCGQTSNNSSVTDTDSRTEVENVSADSFENTDLGDAELLQYVQDNITANLEATLKTDDITVDNVETIYISKEYLEEMEYNSKSNIYFGYTLQEIEKKFSGDKYIFTLGDDGKTVVKQFEPYDDTNEKFLKNVAMGTGVILVCVTVSVATGGVGLPAVSMVFAASAKTGAAMALSSGAIGGLATGIATGVQTGDMNQALKAAENAAGENFKWGAITGVISGGATEAITLKNAAKSTKGVVSLNSKVPTPWESQTRAVKKFGGKEQVAYYKGKEVPYNCKNSTRPDIVREYKGKLEAVEVKNYNLANPNNRKALCNTVKRQVSYRVKHLGPNMTQRIALDVKGRGYPRKLISVTKQQIRNSCADVYPNIPISVMK